jgi:hypothetical protein
MGKKSGSESGMNNPDHISESLETIFELKYRYLNSLMRIRDGKKFGSGSRDKHPGSATLAVSTNKIPYRCVRTYLISNLILQHLP